MLEKSPTRGLFFSFQTYFCYRCDPCDAHVGCHGLTKKALGRLGKKELRQAHVVAHEHFDKLWKSKIFTRTEAYRWLSKILEIPHDYTHIAYFSEDTCRKVYTVSKRKWKMYWEEKELLR